MICTYVHTHTLTKEQSTATNLSLVFVFAGNSSAPGAWLLTPSTAIHTQHTHRQVPHLYSRGYRYQRCTWYHTGTYVLVCNNQGSLQAGPRGTGRTVGAKKTHWPGRTAEFEHLRIPRSWPKCRDLNISRAGPGRAEPDPVEHGFITGGGPS